MKIQVEVMPAQLARIDTLARCLNVTPGFLLVASTLGAIDAFCSIEEFLESWPTERENYAKGGIRPGSEYIENDLAETLNIQPRRFR